MSTHAKRTLNVDVILVITLFLPIFAEQFASVFLAFLSNLVSSNIDTGILNVTSLVSSVITLPGALYSCIASGTSIRTSHAMGAGDTQRARSLFTTSMHFGLVIATVIAVVISLSNRVLIRSVYPAMSEHFFQMAGVYAVFAALCFPIDFYQTNTIGIMRSCLNTKGAFLISLGVSLVSLSFKAFFMICLDMGIWGLCIALVISKLFSLIICSVIIKKIGIFKGCLFDFKNFISKDAALDIFKYGIVMCAETLFASIGGVVLSKILADLGDLQVTGFTIATSMQSLFSVVPNALAYAAQISSGRYKGAGEEEHSLRLAMRITLVGTLLHMAILFATLPFAERLALLYTRDEEILSVVLNVYKVYVYTMPIVWSFGNTLSAGIRGYGNVRQPAITIVACLWAFKIPATYFALSVLHTGAVGRTVVNSVEMGIYALSFLGYYFFELYRIKKRNKQPIA